MVDLSNISQFALYFLAKDAMPLVVAEKEMLAPIVVPQLGAGWAERLFTESTCYRDSVEDLIREATETTDALQTIAQISLDVSDWRQLVTGIARTASPARRDVLMEAAGWRLGSPRSPKEMKDMLLTIKVRMKVHAEEFIALGLAPVLLELPGRVLALLEGGAGDVAREKAEDSLARANMAEFYEKVNGALSSAWRAAELLQLQAQLLERRDDATADEKAEHKALGRRAGELVVKLEKSLGEARVQANKRAATEPLPPGLNAPVVTPEVEVEETSAVA